MRPSNVVKGDIFGVRVVANGALHFRSPTFTDSERNFMRKLDEALQCGRARIERCRPGLYVRNVFETRVSNWSSFSCFPDEPRNMRGLYIGASDTGVSMLRGRRRVRQQ